MVMRRRREVGKQRFFHRRKVCAFCVEKMQTVDYKNVDRIRRYLSEWAKITSSRKTGTCGRHQRMLALAIKRARHLALLPFAAKQTYNMTHSR